MAADNDIVDVEFETIRADGKTIARSPSPGAPTNTANDQETDEQLAVFGDKKIADPKPLSLPIFTLIATICVVGAFFIAGGYKLLQPTQTTEPVPVALEAAAEELPFKISDVTTNVLERSTGRVLNIRATVQNTDKIAQAIPSILVHLNNNSANPRMFRINRGEVLNPGEKLVFTSSMPIGNSAGSDPELSFAQ